EGGVRRGLDPLPGHGVPSGVVADDALADTKRVHVLGLLPRLVTAGGRAGAEARPAADLTGHDRLVRGDVVHAHVRRVDQRGVGVVVDPGHAVGHAGDLTAVTASGPQGGVGVEGLLADAHYAFADADGVT